MAMQARVIQPSVAHHHQHLQALPCAWLGARPRAPRLGLQPAPCRQQTLQRHVTCQSSTGGPSSGNGQHKNEPTPANTPSTSPQAAAAAATASEKLYLGLPALTWQKAIPLGLMFFCILFNYTTLRNTKDVLVVTAPGSGAEVIPFLKTLDLPMAVLFTVAYTTLSNRLTSDMLFYACLWPFVGFFALFGFLVYPNKEMLHPTELCNHLAGVLGERWSAPLSLLRTWTFSVFYMIADMWGSIVVSLLFWGLANQIMTVDEAATFYPLFGMGANLSLIVAGNVTHRLSEMRATLPPGVDGWGVALQALMGLVLLNGVIISVLHWGLQKWVLPKAQRAAGKGGAAPKPRKAKKAKMSMGESFRFLASSPYIRDLATMVVSFGVAIQLVEVTWKARLKAAYPDPGDYSAFMGKFSEGVGFVTLGMMLVGRYVLQRWGWGVAALATPTVILVTAVAFLVLVLSEGMLKAPLAVLGTTPLMAAVVVGSVQNIFSRASKYSLFDPCKEMAYIPLDDEIKGKGKAAVDVVGNLLGKSGGAVLQQAAIFTFGSLAASTPYLGLILTAVILNWIRSVLSLEKQFHALMKSTGQDSDQEHQEQEHEQPGAEQHGHTANGNGNGNGNGAAAAPGAAAGGPAEAPRQEGPGVQAPVPKSATA